MKKSKMEEPVFRQVLCESLNLFFHQYLLILFFLVNISNKIAERGGFMSYIPFLDLESKVQETLRKEDQEIKCSQCPEYEACISGEPLAIPCPLERSKDVK